MRSHPDSPLWLRKLRLITGLTLFTYVTLHLLNHSLGNISIPALEAGLIAQKWIWQGVLGTSALYAALSIHFSLGLFAFYERRHFGWPPREVLQLVLGLSIPFLLMNHLFATRVSLATFGTEKGYAQELYSFWVGAPYLGALQVSVLIIGWLHGCIGVYQWLRLKRGFDRWKPWLLCASVLLPVLALLGYFQAGRTLLSLAHDPAWRAANLNPWQVGTPAQNHALVAWRDDSLAAWAGLIVLTLLARLFRAWRERRGRSFVVTYPNGRTVRVPVGFSVLEASKSAHVPHASICGGRGRCSTCRIRIIYGEARLPAPSPGEQLVLRHIAAPSGVRLACQTHPTADLCVAPLLPPDWAAVSLRRREWPQPGEERFVVVVMVDMRNSTRLAETRLPFDAVFIVDRFVSVVGRAIDANGGRVSNFLGDGVMATFGISCPPEAACRQALATVAAIGSDVSHLNGALRAQVGEEIRFGIGMHCGFAVIGGIGYGAMRTLTTLGDTANVAARLEGLCKEFGCEAVVSDDVFRTARLPGGDVQVVNLRGRVAALAVHPIMKAADLLKPAAAS